MRSKLLAEAIGTFALLFAGTGAIVVNDLTGGVITHVGVALTFGLVIMAMIYSVGDLSGAHFNPAVTFGFWLAGRLPAREVLPYLASQLGGALVASGVLRLLFPTHATLGATLPVGGLIPAFVLEVVLTFFLMFVIINVATGSKEVGIMAGAAIGATVGLAALFGGPISGASMNPVRSLAPALLSANLNALWIYLVAPLLGSALAILVHRGMKGAPATQTHHVRASPTPMDEALSS
jgi:aquaporin NIP